MRAGVGTRSQVCASIGAMLRYVVSLLAIPLLGQSWYPKHNFTFGAGVGRPRGDLVSYFSDSPAVAVGYGYRFHPNLQIDVGLDTVFHAAGVKDFYESGFGAHRIRDYQFMVPMGGRAILPLAGGRLLFAGGGGGAYMRYSERIYQPSDYYQIDCPVCASRDGWGYYGLLSATAFVDRAKHFRLGVTSKVYRGHTDGEPLGSAPGARTRDRWINVYGEFGFSF